MRSQVRVLVTAPPKPHLQWGFLLSRKSRRLQNLLLPGVLTPSQPRANLGRLGAIAQLGERLLCTHEVVGSIPSGSTKRDRTIVRSLFYSADGEGAVILD